MRNNSNLSGHDDLANDQSRKVIRSVHKDYLSESIEIDISDLWFGGGDTRSSKRKNWLGSYSGRPGLASALFDTIKALAAPRKPQGINSLLHELRSFWRFLDLFEKNAGENKYFPRVDSIELIDTLHGERWLRPIDNEWVAARPEKYRSILSILQISRQAAVLPPLYWPPASNPDRVNRGDSPSKGQGVALIRLLTRRAHKIWKRWEDADAMAGRGRIILGLSRREINNLGVTEADIHATYREIIRQTGEPAPILSMVAERIGFSLPLPRWWPKHPVGHPRQGRTINIEDDLMPGLYPTGEDLYCLASLFMARSGWNPTTLFALDCSSEASWCRPYGEELIWLHSYKYRGGSWQDTISPRSHSTHCYQIVLKLYERSRPLREKLKEDRTRCDLPAVAERSPWLSARDSKNFQVLGSHSLNQIRAYLGKVILEYNSCVSPSAALPIFKPSDFRDVFAEAVHRGGNYSIFLTQIALGHKTISSTRRYLRSLAWRKESELRLNDLVSSVFEQIEVHKIIDLTLLRAKMDGVNITQEQIGRLDAYRKSRTYSGLGCSDPTNPPQWIDPYHPRDGETVCAQGHRCPCCPKGKVFKDSLPQLAKCLAELEWKRATIGDLRWYQSTDSLDLEVIEATLAQWPVAEVEREASVWRKKISNGDHNVLVFAAGVH